MKKVYLLILAVLLLVGISQRNSILASFNKVFYQSVCDSPIHYKIGLIDPRFNISENEFKTDIQRAESVWEGVEQKDLFVYDPKGILTINLVFDKRQALTNEINQFENNIETQKNQINPEIAQYEKDVTDFKQRLNSLNEEISSWNSKGGAPPEVYSQIIHDQQSLQEEAARLNATANRLNQSTSLFNADIGRLNETVNSFNQTLAKKPEEGLYDGVKKQIYIYFLTNQNELIHTLAHEMGHALGLGHVGGVNSIMYPLTSRTLTPSSEDMAAIEKLCTKQNLIEILLKRLQTQN